MLVVDRRADEGLYAPGVNRAEAQAQLEKLHFEHGRYESTALPAQVETGAGGPSEVRTSTGVACIVKTPGHDVLLHFLLERVWGITVNR
jgi:hypothetical protein